MKIVRSIRCIGRLVAVLLLATALGYLARDQIFNGHLAGPHQLPSPEVEDTARRDTVEAERLARELDERTLDSLSRATRQRLAAIAAIVAAGLCLALAPRSGQRKPNAPVGIADLVARRRAEVAVAAAATECSTPQALPPIETMQPDLSQLDEIVQRTGSESRHLISLLHAINATYRFLPPRVLTQLPRVADVTAPQVAGVASFYTQFRTRPRGQHLVEICQGTACHVGGAARVIDELKRQLGVPIGSDTDLAGRATVERVGCLGCCTLAPVIRTDGEVSRVRMDDVARVAQVLTTGHVNGASSAFFSDPDMAIRKGVRTPRRACTSGQVSADSKGPDPFSDRIEIRIGLGSCCVAGGSRAVWETCQRELRIERRNAVVKQVGCVGICHLTPLVEVHVPNMEPIVATRATPADVRRILRTLPGRPPISVRLRRRLAEPGHGRRDQGHDTITSCSIMPLAHPRIQQFVGPQVRIVTEHCGEMDPNSMVDYLARDGFVALEQCLRSMNPAEVVNEIEASGLRGRGGGGFPTATKWRKAAQADGQKFVVCNGDEGDPGAFMDRMIMESYPFRVLEGMAIAAYAVGAERALVYVRHEYTLAVKRLRHAVVEMGRAGWLGRRIAGTEYSLAVEIVEGAGAFVCGEETALLKSIMGGRGTPRLRPPYPVESGLWNQPTLVNNVETFANVPWILRHGASEFSRLGTATSKGTKVFSLSGKVRRGGLIEIPMGTTIRDVVEGLGGGVQAGKSFKAVQIGGPSGGCVPASLADTQIDYESLQDIGAIMGSGGLVVLDNDDCMVDMSRYFLDFTQRESCGHCTFCRLGTKRLLSRLEGICAGHGQRRDLDYIEQLCSTVVAGSLCGLGKTAPNPVLTTLRYFRDEYEAHLLGHCPAGRCRALIHYEVTPECVGCTLCAQHCPVGAIPVTPYRQHAIDSAVCTRCDVCRLICPEDAIRVVS